MAPARRPHLLSGRRSDAVDLHVPSGGCRALQTRQSTWPRDGQSNTSSQEPTAQDQLSFEGRRGQSSQRHVPNRLSTPGETRGSLGRLSGQHRQEERQGGGRMRDTSELPPFPKEDGGRFSEKWQR